MERIKGITRTRTGFKARIRTAGVDRSKVFPTLDAAIAWQQAGGLTNPDQRISIRRAIELCVRIWDRQKDGFRTLRIAEALADVVGEDEPLNSLTTQAVRDLVRVWQAEGLANATINRRLSVVSTLFSEANEAGISVPAPIIRKLPARRREFTFTRKQETELLDAWPRNGEETKLLTRWLFASGCRVGEALGLRWDDVDLARGTVRFRHTKSRRERHLPLTADMELILSTAPEGSVGPFTTVTAQTHHRHWTQAKEALSWSDKDVVPHACRHTWATRALDAGVDIAVVSHWLGHATIAETMRYVHLNISHLRPVVEKLA